MYKNLVMKEISEHRWKLVIGLIILAILAMSLPILFDYIHDILYILEDLPLPLGNELLQEINLHMSNYDIYLWSQWNGKNLPQTAIIISLILGSTTIASEISKGTLEFLLSKPVSKKKVFLSKIMVSLTFLLILHLIPTLVMLLTSAVTGKVNYGGLVFMGLGPVFLGMVTSYFLALLISLYCEDPVKAFAYSAGLLVINSLGAITTTTEKLSLSYHYIGADYIIQGRFPYISTVTLIVISLALCILSYNRFISKEY